MFLGLNSELNVELVYTILKGIQTQLDVSNNELMEQSFEDNGSITTELKMNKDGSVDQLVKLKNFTIKSIYLWYETRNSELKYDNLLRRSTLEKSTASLGHS